MENVTDWKKRVKNPLFIAAAAGLAYQIMAQFGVAPDEAMYKTAIDIVSFVFIGAGVYSTFPKSEK